MAAEEDEIKAAGGAVALLGDDQLGLGALFVGDISLIEIRAVDEQDDVRVLLDGARFAEVGELRLALLAFWRASQLAENEHGNLQFLRQRLQRARNTGDFFLAVGGAAIQRRNDELNVIHDDERKPSIALQPAGFRSHFENS